MLCESRRQPGHRTAKRRKRKRRRKRCVVSIGARRWLGVESRENVDVREVNKERRKRKRRVRRHAANAM